MEVKGGHPGVDTFQGGRFVWCLNKSSLEVVIATPRVLLVPPQLVPSIPPFSLATFCGLPLSSYGGVSALCDRIVSVYGLNLL